MTTFALLAGAGAGAWNWHLLTDELWQRGHPAIAVELPWTDDAAGLQAFTDVAVDQIGEATDDLVVVAQSLSAFLGPLVADRLPDTRLLVLLAPMVPALHETPGEWWQNVGHHEAIATTFERFGPMSAWGDDALTHVFLHDLPPDVIAASAEHNGPPGSGIFASRLDLDAWPDVPTAVVACDEDRLFPPAFVTHLAKTRLGVTAHTTPGGHAAMLSRPAELAQTLIALRDELTPGG